MGEFNNQNENSNQGPLNQNTYQPQSQLPPVYQQQYRQPQNNQQPGNQQQYQQPQNSQQPYNQQQYQQNNPSGYGQPQYQQPQYSGQSQYQQPVYQQPNQQYRPPMQQNNYYGLAIASMICGIVSLIVNCCVWYLSLPAAVVGLILGIINLKNNGKGKGMAIAGVILNGITLALFLLILMGCGLYVSAIWQEII